MKTSMEIDVKSAVKGYDGLGKAFKKALPASLNRTIAKAKTAESREVRRQYNITAKRLNAGTKVQKASAAKLRAEIDWRGTRPGLLHFGAAETAKGVKVRVRKGGKKKLIRHAFRATMPSGGQGIFRRKGKDRLPIKPLTGPDIAQMAGNKNVQAAFDKSIKDNFDIEFRRALTYYQGK